MNCGKEFESKTWGAKCDCENPNVVHLMKCKGCEEIIGQITYDDYNGPEKIYCPNCIKEVILKRGL